MYNKTYVFIGLCTEPTITARRSLRKRVYLLRQLHSVLLLLRRYARLTASRTTLVSPYQKGKTSLDLNEARDDGVLGWQWYQLDHYANNLHLAPDR